MSYIREYLVRAAIYFAIQEAFWALHFSGHGHWAISAACIYFTVKFLLCLIEIWFTTKIFRECDPPEGWEDMEDEDDDEL